MPVATPVGSANAGKRERWVSLGEALAGVLIVLGHNVFRAVPNEVPILFALFWLSLRVRTGAWRAPEFRRPASWGKTALMAAGAAIVLQAGSELAIQPLAARFFPDPQSISSLIQTETMNLSQTLQTLVLVWVFAALGEETGYRGYLMSRMANAGGQSQQAWIVAMMCTAVLFGFGHFYKGPAGIVDSTYSGLVLGSVYLLAGRSLWAAILAHGFSDTFAVAAVYAGWAK